MEYNKRFRLRATGMGNKRLTFYSLLGLIVFLMAALTSCQKDSTAGDVPQASARINADSSVLSSSGNFLAASGTLKIKFNDSVYTFDASRDSIAFINVNGDDKARYFGITAINKSHTISFGISSAGFAYSNINRSIAGSQLLFSTDASKPSMQLSLTRNATPTDLGSLTLVQYKNNDELASGSFYTFLSLDDKVNSPYYRVEGSFDLKLK